MAPTTRFKCQRLVNGDSGLVFLLGAAASFLIAIPSYYYFLGSDYFVSAKSAWSTAAGYTKQQFVLFVLGTYFLPFGVICMLIFISKSSKNVPSRCSNIPSAYYKLPLYVLLVIIFSIGCAVAARHSDNVLNCIGHFCIGTLVGRAVAESSSSSPGVVSANLVLFFISLFFVMIFTVVAAIEGIVVFQRYSSSSRAHSRVDVYEPLGPGSYGSGGGLYVRSYVKEEIDRIDRNDKANMNNTKRMSIRNDRSDRDDRNNMSDLNNNSMNHINDGRADPIRSMDALRDNERRHRYAYRRAWLSEAIFIALVFFMFFPIFIFACTILPTWWTGFTRYEIQKYQKFVPPQAYGTYWAVKMNETVVLKVFPDIALYYGFIYLVSLLALTAQFWPPLKRFFFIRLTRTVSVGQALLAVGLVALLVSEWCYWFFSHAWENNLTKPRPTAEKAARSLGQIANVVIGLLVLPVAKNGVWSRVFGVSWEGLIAYHRMLGYAFLLIVLAHMLSWWYVYHLKGSFPSDIFAVPMTYHKDNFTVPLSVLTSLFMFVIMGGLTFHVVRRLNYELFYYFHLFSGVVFLSVLW